MSSAQASPKTKSITIQIATGAMKGDVFNLEKPIIKIGRGPENDIVLDKDAKISRVHAEIHQTQGLFQIHNVTEKNSMLVNGKLLKVAILDGNTAVVIGDTQFNILFSMNVPRIRPVPSRQLPSKMTNALQSQSFAPQQTAGFSQAGMSSEAYVAPAAGGSKRSPLLLGFIVISIIGIVGAYYFSRPNKNPPKPAGLKSIQKFEEEIDASAKETDIRSKELEKRGQNSIQYNMAQQHYVKGFRDFQHQQYARSITSFKASLSYFPQHELARRYLIFAQKKLEEIIQEYMDSGAKYKGQGNNRMCVATYSKVLRTIEDIADKNYKAAEQYKLECEAQMKDRY